MAEPARVRMTGDVVRVRLRIANPWRAQELAGLLGERGYLVAPDSGADVTLGDGEPDGLLVIAEGESAARGVLPADASADQIDAALRAVAAGLSVHVPRDGRFSALDEDQAPSPLTPRELEILIGLSEGLSNKAIARRFDISQHTVKFHAESIFRKLGATSRADAVARGLRRRLVHL
ncbi:MAG TPA: response regulator transcription factor [Rhizomicrobium sp.]|nr:response regulator transcription factor [Rhizomicrobium sp.]